MAKLQKIETDYRYYEYELTDEEYQLYQEDEDTFWDEVDPEWEFTWDKQPGDEITVIEE